MTATCGVCHPDPFCLVGEPHLESFNKSNGDPESCHALQQSCSPYSITRFTKVEECSNGLFALRPLELICDEFGQLGALIGGSAALSTAALLGAGDGASLKPSRQPVC